MFCESDAQLGYLNAKQMERWDCRFNPHPARLFSITRPASEGGEGYDPLAIGSGGI